jgi:glycosyltransferase involved in cell wall biosynthesis
MKTIVEITPNTTSAPCEALMRPEPTGFSLSASGSYPADRTHVLFLIDQLCEMGGAERSLLNMIRLLPKDRFRCTLVTFKIDPRLGVFENFPCPWRLFPLRRTYDWNALQVALRLNRLIRAQQVRIVHTFFETSDLWGSLVAKLSGVPALISSRRDMGILRASKHQPAYRVLSRLYNLVLAVSDEVRAFCIRHDGLNPEKVLTLYNGIEIERIAAVTDAATLRASMGLGGASHLVSTVAHVRPVKGLDILIRAAATVCQEFPRAMFLVIGDVHAPRHFQELLKLTESLGLKENVRFVGPSEDVFSLLKMSDVFCLPSRSEGFSNALLEAMACSLPCVATRVGGNSEALEEGRSGFLIESENPHALADRIRTLLRHPERAREMGREGRRMVEAKFTMQAMMSRLVELYDGTLKAKRR